jgi:hypothetical protein
MMTRRTYSREAWLEAQDAWKAGDFSAEWRDWRHWAATEGTIIFPPDGTKWDQWDEDSPSQRAMVIRAIRETPDMLRHALRGARSWSEVIARLLPDRDILRADTAEDERQAAYATSTRRSDAHGALDRLRDLLKEKGLA